MTTKSKKFTSFGDMVYSTNPDWKPEIEEELTVSLPPQQQDLRVMIDRKQRGGKSVTLVTGYRGSDDALNELCKYLKAKCGVGGNAKNGEIIIQGEQPDKVIKLLIEKGFKVKRSGG
jgi:translation initiation factor 1